MKHPKTPDERLREALQIAQQLAQSGLPYDDPRVAELRAALKDFADAGIGYSRTLKLPESRLALVAKLSCQRHIPSAVRITRL